jgi:hypothetical protein
MIMQPKHTALIVWGARLSIAGVWLLVQGLLIGESVAWGSAWQAPLTWFNYLLVPALALLMLALVVEVVIEKTQAGSLQRATQRLLFWTPRVLGVLLCLILAPLAFDVFALGLGFWQTIGALLIHLMPLLVLLALLAAAWRWEWLGAVAFGLFGLWALSINVHDAIPFSVYLLVVGIPLLIAALMALNWIYHTEVRDRHRSVAA